MQDRSEAYQLHAVGLEGLEQAHRTMVAGLFSGTSGTLWSGAVPSACDPEPACPEFLYLSVVPGCVVLLHKARPNLSVVY